MNSIQMHLALTHVPVILSICGLIMLVVAFFLKNNTLIRTSYVLILVAGVAVIPVFLSGEGSEEVVEKIPGISEAVMERHEDVARLAMISIIATSLTALAALFASKWQIAARVTKISVLVFAIFSGGLMAQTAHLGGQIRHPEITNTAVAPDKGENNDGNEANAIELKEEDDD